MTLTSPFSGEIDSKMLSDEEVKKRLDTFMVELAMTPRGDINRLQRIFEHTHLLNPGENLDRLSDEALAERISQLASKLGKDLSFAEHIMNLADQQV